MGGDKHRALLGILREKAELAAVESGVELVDLSVRGSSRKRLVRIDIDRAGPEGVNLDDCQRVSRALEERLDADAEADEIIGGSYTLEVSSPGIERQIESDDDVRRNTGRFVRIDYEDDDGTPRFARGVLAGGDRSALHLETNDGNLELPRERVKSARQDVNS